MANGYFRIALRRAPCAAPVWSYALEWNRCLRSIGFIGDVDAARSFMPRLVPLTFTQMSAGIRGRPDVPLDPIDDHLFQHVETAAES